MLLDIYEVIYWFLLFILGFIYLFIYLFQGERLCDPHSISEGGGNAHLKVVCQPPFKEKKKMTRFSGFLHRYLYRG